MLNEPLKGIYEIHDGILITVIPFDQEKGLLTLMPNGETPKEALILVWQKVSADPKERDSVGKAVGEWDPKRRAAEDLEVAKALSKANRPGYARPLLMGLVDRFGETPAGRQAAEVLMNFPNSKP